MAEFTCDPGHFQLTDAMKTSFHARGYVLVRGFLSDAQVDKVKTSVEHERYLRHGHQYTDPNTGEVNIRKVMWRHPGHDVVGKVSSRL